MATIYDRDGNLLTAGLQGCNVCDEAIIVAQRIANGMGEPVILEDDDGEWIIEPDAAVDSAEAECRP